MTDKRDELNLAQLLTVANLIVRSTLRLQKMIHTHLEGEIDRLDDDQILPEKPVFTPKEAVLAPVAANIAPEPVFSDRRRHNPTPQPETPPDCPGDLYTTEAAAKFLGLTGAILGKDRYYYKTRIKAGMPLQEAHKLLRVPFRRMGGRIFYRRSDLEAALEGRQREPLVLLEPEPARTPPQRYAPHRPVANAGGRVTKRMRKLLDAVRKMPEATGIEIELRPQNGHLHLFAKKGEGEEHKLAVMPSTPGDWRGDRNGMMNIRRALKLYAVGEGHA